MARGDWFPSEIEGEQVYKVSGKVVGEVAKSMISGKFWYAKIDQPIGELVVRNSEAEAKKWVEEQWTDS